ncbi:hypothetical protein HPB50_005537 [Hyalomma asiaticum]|uniref:Uncharacterized protein n=1 Tax=Hyalomma asiaticum TaxID=266040 RepID=A0ACB7SL77_HYAAI|nr:hypothetical protein HPB50_005537 [Hyalomma asiaticum]
MPPDVCVRSTIVAKKPTPRPPISRALGESPQKWRVVPLQRTKSVQVPERRDAQLRAVRGRLGTRGGSVLSWGGGRKKRATAVIPAVAPLEDSSFASPCQRIDKSLSEPRSGSPCVRVVRADAAWTEEGRTSEISFPQAEPE